MATLENRIKALESQRQTQSRNYHNGGAQLMSDEELVQVITGKYPESSKDYPSDDELMSLIMESK